MSTSLTIGGLGYALEVLRPDLVSLTGGSRGNTYRLTRTDNGWVCDCRDAAVRKHLCKHSAAVWEWEETRRKEAMTEKSASELTERLAEPFDPDEVKWKPQVVKENRAYAIAYIDARVVMDRLDEVLGVGGWQDTYEFLPDGSCLCKLQLFIGGTWITKMDVGGESEQKDEGDRHKAALSDALKRTAIKFGVGRYLYRLPGQWVDYDPQRKKFLKDPVLPAWARGKGTAQTQQPAQPGSNTASAPPPENGEELLKRLKRYEAQLVERGLCGAEELLNHVFSVGQKRGLPSNIRTWQGDQITWAMGEATEFQRGRKEKVQKSA